PVAAVVGLVDDVAVLAQALADVFGGLLVVFDEEDLHGVALRKQLSSRAKRGIRDRRRERSLAALGMTARQHLPPIPQQIQRSPTIQTFNAAAMRAPWPQPHIPFAKSPRSGGSLR